MPRAYSASQAAYPALMEHVLRIRECWPRPSRRVVLQPLPAGRRLQFMGGQPWGWAARLRLVVREGTMEGAAELSFGVGAASTPTPAID